MSTQATLFPLEEAPPLAGEFPFWVRSRIRGRALNIGRVAVVTGLEPGTRWAVLNGQPVFYREQRYEKDFLHYGTKSLGCCAEAWAMAKRYGCRYLATYALDKRRLYIASDNMLNYEDSFGAERQVRAKVRNCLLVEGFPPLPVGPTDRFVEVEGRFNG